MKKFILLIISLLLLSYLFGCSPDTYEIALISAPDNQDFFSQKSWEGIEEFGKDNAITTKMYNPTESTTSSYFTAIEEAIEGGAKVIVAPGKRFEEVIYKAQFQYPEVSFILIDGTPYSGGSDGIYETAQNTLCIVFNNSETGFLAGYTAVKEGYTSLGFIGATNSSSVAEYGIGFFAGSHYAAMEMEIDLEFSKDTYHHLNYSIDDGFYENLAEMMYLNGTELIFSAGGVNSHILLAIEQTDGSAILTEEHTPELSKKVIANAVKALDVVVKEELERWNNGNFIGGQCLERDTLSNGIALQFYQSSFVNFTREEYDGIISKISNRTIVVPRTRSDLISFFAESSIVINEFPSFDIINNEE